LKTFTIHQAKTNLSKLIERVCQGEEIVICLGPQPVARLVPVSGAKGRRQPGALRGKLHVPPEFFEPLPADELAGWE
jgi:prevent-host-death family protein